jgi:ketosteroid isomerase-like protein
MSVRDTIAAYTQALDDGRVDDVVATFTADGSIDIPGMGAHTGTDALRLAYRSFQAPVPLKHLVVNTLVDERGDEATATSDVVVLAQGAKGWRIQVVGRYHDALRKEGAAWRFTTRRAEFR